MSAHTSPVEAGLESWLARALAGLEGAGLRRGERPVRRLPDGRVEWEGREIVDFSSNDYLGLASDPRPAEAAAGWLAGDGLGAGAARLISGTHPAHLALERALAERKGKEAALLFGSGYAANVGTIPALAGPGDILYSDELNHASIIDGCRLSRAEVRVFPHRDLETLRRLLEADRSRERRASRGGGERGDREGAPSRWILVEGVYSMEGDLFPLDRLVPLAREHGARLYLDDAHGTGVVGRSGRGSADHFGVTHACDVIVGTLGKAIGTTGAFVVGSERLRSWLLNRARSFVYSTAPPAALAVATLASLQILASEPERRERLLERARLLAEGLTGLGWGPDRVGPGHIVPIRIGNVTDTMRVAGALSEQGYLVGAIRPPSVPPGSARLRIGVSAAHRPEDVAGLLRVLGRVLPAGPGRTG